MSRAIQVEYYKSRTFMVNVGSITNEKEEWQPLPCSRVESVPGGFEISRAVRPMVDWTSEIFPVGRLEIWLVSPLSESLTFRRDVWRYEDVRLLPYTLDTLDSGPASETLRFTQCSKVSTEFVPYDDRVPEPLRQFARRIVLPNEACTWVFHLAYSPDDRSSDSREVEVRYTRKEDGSVIANLQLQPSMIGRWVLSTSFYAEHKNVLAPGVELTAANFDELTRSVIAFLVRYTGRVVTGISLVGG